MFSHPALCQLVNYCWVARFRVTQALVLFEVGHLQHFLRYFSNIWILLLLNTEIKITNQENVKDKRLNSISIAWIVNKVLKNVCNINLHLVRRLLILHTFNFMSPFLKCLWRTRNSNPRTVVSRPSRPVTRVS